MIFVFFLHREIQKSFYFMDIMKSLYIFLQYFIYTSLRVHYRIVSIALHLTSMANIDVVVANINPCFSYDESLYRIHRQKRTHGTIWWYSRV